MMLVNLTNKPVVLLDDKDCEILRLPTHGAVVNASVINKVMEQLSIGSGIVVDVVTSEYTAVSGLPEPRTGVMFVVGYAVLRALKGSRPDVIAPDTSPSSVVREHGGVVKGVRRFCRL